MSTSDAPRQGRRDAGRETAHQELVKTVARDCLRRRGTRPENPQPPLPEVPRATRRPWSRAPRPSGVTPVIELIRSLARGERSRQQ